MQKFDVIKPKQVNIKISVRTYTGQPLRNVKLTFTRVDDQLYQKPVIFSAKTDETGLAILKIPQGCYVLRFSSGKSKTEKVIEIYDNGLVTFRFLFFGKLPRNKLISNKKLNVLFEEFRADYFICFKCKEKYTSITDKFKCSYCGMIFCSKDRVPETHTCKGGPFRKAPGSFRELHSKYGTRATGVGEPR
jgi:hypothetical protein